MDLQALINQSNDEIGGFLQSHAAGSPAVTQKDCIRDIRFLCKRLAVIQKGWMEASEATLDEATVKALEGNVHKLEVWIVERNLTHEIGTLLKANATALVRLLPWKHIKQQHKQYHRECWEALISLENMVFLPKKPIDWDLRDGLVAARALRSLFLSLETAEGRRLSPEQRSQLAYDISVDLSQLLQAQTDCFQKLSGYLNAERRRCCQQIEQAKTKILKNSQGDVYTLIHDYRRLQRAITNLGEVEKNYETLSSAKQNMEQLLTFPTSDPMIKQAQQKLLQRLSSTRLDTTVSAPDITSCDQHLLTRLHQIDPTGREVLRAMSDRLAAYRKKPHWPREESLLDLAFFGALTLETPRLLGWTPSRENADGLIKIMQEHRKRLEKSHPQSEQAVKAIHSGTFDSKTLSSSNFSHSDILSLMQSAISANNAKAVDILFTHTPDVAAAKTMAYQAVQRGHEKVLRVLMKHGAEIDLDEKLLDAVTQDDLDRATVFLKLGAKTEHTNMTSPLVNAALRGNVAMIELLLQYGADVNFRDNDNSRSPLAAAILEHQSLAVQTLLQAGALTGMKDTLSWRRLSGAIFTIPHAAIHEIGQATMFHELVTPRLLSHSLKFSGNLRFRGGILPLEGAVPPRFADEMLTTFQAFVREYPNRLEAREIAVLESLLHSTAVDRSKVTDTLASQVYQRNQPDSVITISTGFINHSVQIVIYGDYLIINNKGAQSRIPGEMYKIDKDKLTHSMILYINELVDHPMENYKGWRGRFPQQLGAQRTDFTKFIERLYPLFPLQLVGNCAWESLETAVFFTLATVRFLNDFDAGNWPDPLAIKKVQEDFVHWLRFTQVHILEKYFDQVDNGEIIFSVELATLVFQQIWSIPSWPLDLSARIDKLEKRFMGGLSPGMNREIVKATKVYSQMTQWFQPTLETVRIYARKAGLW